MIEAYVKLILAKKKTLEQVPDKIRNTVKEALIKAGWKETESEER